jgi:predicted metal-binding protein
MLLCELASALFIDVCTLRRWPTCPHRHFTHTHTPPENVRKERVGYWFLLLEEE